MITIVDYGRGNLFSLAQAFRHLGVDAEVTADAGRVAAAGKLIVPGVGAFLDAMDALQARDLVAPIKAAAANAVPIFGICLGMQLFAERSFEFGDHKGLGLVPGEVRRLADEGDTGPHPKVPNVGWREVEFLPGRDAFGTNGTAPMYYFVHSYAFHPADPADLAAYSPFGAGSCTAMIRRGNVAGCQFHPEKSGRAGIDLLSYVAKVF